MPLKVFLFRNNSTMAATSDDTQYFGRTELLMGRDFMRRIGEVRVIVLGVGGVGSWCVESLVRTGVRHITLVDCDLVSATNVNRQLMATRNTVGQVKVEALKAHLLEINPAAEITALQRVYSQESAAEFHLETYDYIVDAIDSLKDKLALILHATRLMREGRGVTFFSSMGAALRTDPFAIRQAEFWEVKGDPLARMLRKRFKALDEYPAHKFQCVYSTELPRENQGEGVDEALHPALASKARTNGTMAHVTIIFGTALAGMIVNDIEKHLPKR